MAKNFARKVAKSPIFSAAKKDRKASASFDTSFNFGANKLTKRERRNLQGGGGS
jgi:hypothetical protein